MTTSTTPDRLRRSIERFRYTSVLIVGDVMLDQFVVGRVNRISPEAPVPVVEFEYDEYRVGGASNVAHNVRALGGEVELVGLTGTDAAGQRLRRLLGEHGIGTSGLVGDPSRRTTTKLRIVTNRNQQVARIDYETDREADRRDRGGAGRAGRVARAKGQRDRGVGLPEGRRDESAHGASRGGRARARHPRARRPEDSRTSTTTPARPSSRRTTTRRKWRRTCACGPTRRRWPPRAPSGSARAVSGCSSRAASTGCACWTGNGRALPRRRARGLGRYRRRRHGHRHARARPRGGCRLRRRLQSGQPRGGHLVGQVRPGDVDGGGTDGWPVEAEPGRRLSRPCSRKAIEPFQCRKCRRPANTIARPCSSAAAITSASRTDPPG